MKSIKRILLGIISSLLLAVGFVHAAGDLDPLALAAASHSDPQMSGRAGDNCSLNCDIADGS